MGDFERVRRRPESVKKPSVEGRALSRARIEVVPTAVAPKSFQTHEGFVSWNSPELAGAFETALILATGRLNRPGTNWVVSQLFLLLSRFVFIHRFPGFQHLLVFHA